LDVIEIDGIDDDAAFVELAADGAVAEYHRASV
jgi:hypothetical protein